MSKHYNQYVFKSAVRDAMFVGHIATQATMCDYLPNSRHNLLMVGATSVYFAFVGATSSLDSPAETKIILIVISLIDYTTICS